MAEKVSNTFCKGTECRSAMRVKGNTDWQVSAMSTIRFGECFLPARARGIWKFSLRGVGDWSRGVGGFDGEGDGGPLAFREMFVVEAGRLCGTVPGNCCVVGEVPELYNVVLRPESWLMGLGLTVEGGTPGLADEDVCIGGDGAGGHAGMAYRDGFRSISEVSGFRTMGREVTVGANVGGPLMANVAA